MDALVVAALKKVNEAISKLDTECTESSIAKSVYAVDALKSALKTLTPETTFDRMSKWTPEDWEKYKELSNSNDSSHRIIPIK